MRPIVQMKEQIDRLNDLQCNNWESMAEFSVGLEEDQDDIFLHCTRVTIDDRELLYLSEVKKLFEMVRTCPLVEFPSEYQDDIKKMKELQLPLSFIDLENFLIKDSIYTTFEQEEFDETTDTSEMNDYEDDQPANSMEIYEKALKQSTPQTNRNSLACLSRILPFPETLGCISRHRVLGLRDGDTLSGCPDFQIPPICKIHQKINIYKNHQTHQNHQFHQIHQN